MSVSNLVLQIQMILMLNT